MAFINTLYNLWPNGNERVPGLMDGMAASSDAVFAKYGMTSPLLIAHFMAQVSLECGAGHELVENLNYSASRLRVVWPSHFNASNASEYAFNPQKLANYIYEPPLHNDLGNRPNSTDGFDFRGRGATQTTGRGRYVPATGKTPARYEGYTGLQAFLATKGVDLDLVNKPDLINDPAYFLECGAADYALCGCPAFAAKDNVTGVTKALNGGLTGLADRKVWLVKWKKALGAS